MTGLKPVEEDTLMIATAVGVRAWSTAKEACDALGISPSLIRLWESRYGWPCPRRTANGQRRFSAADLDEIRRVLAQVRAGRPIGSLVVDGRPRLPEAAPRARLDASVLADLPQPARPDARALRAGLTAALLRRDEGAALAWLALAPRDCPPDDRPWAAWSPCLVLLEAWEQRGQALPGAPRLRAALAAQARELLALRRPSAGELGVVAADAAAATVVAAVLTVSGHPARATDAETVDEPYVTVGDHAPAGPQRLHRGHVALSAAGLAELVAREPAWWYPADAVA